MDAGARLQDALALAVHDADDEATDEVMEAEDRDGSLD